MRLAVADEQNKHFTTLRGKYSELEIILLMRYINLRLLTYLLKWNLRTKTNAQDDKTSLR